EVLDLSGNNLARSAVPILVSSANLPRLRRLVLANNLLQDSDARALANSSHLQELRELDLSGNGITREGIEAILDSPLGKRLQRFDRYPGPTGQTSASIRASLLSPGTAMFRSTFSGLINRQRITANREARAIWQDLPAPTRGPSHRRKRAGRPVEIE